MRIWLYHFDRVFTKYIHRLFSPKLKQFFLFVTALGNPPVIIAVGLTISMVGFLYDQDLFWTGAIIPLTLFIGIALKISFERARPVSDYVQMMKRRTFSFPSSHSTGSMSAYSILGYCAYNLTSAPWSLMVFILCISLSILIGISRVQLNAHYPSDVIAGWALGFSSLLAVIYIIQPFA